MVRVNYEKWGESPEFLRAQSLSSAHRRTRERFLALYELTQGCNATSLSEKIGRDPQTVMRWVRKYNICGSAGMTYEKTGGVGQVLKKKRL